MGGLRVLFAIEPNSALTVIALAIGVVGALAAIFKIGPDRTNVVVGYQAQILNDLQQENQRLTGVVRELRVENSQQRGEIDSLKQRVEKLELLHDDPPAELA